MATSNELRNSRRALIVEQGNSRGAVAAVRALHRAGWSVGVGSPRARGSAAASRSCTWRHDIPAAHEDADRFLARVSGLVEAVGYDVVFGAGEAEVWTLSAARDRLATIVPYAAHDVVQRALDKGELEAAAVDAGMAVPATLDPSDLDGPAPVVVKARRHADPDRPGAPPRVDTNVVFGAAAARRRMDDLRQVGAQPFVQELVEGSLLAYAVVTDRTAAVVGESMQVASHIWPPGAGASCRAQTMPVREDIAAPARRLLRTLGWFGLAELQFLIPADATPRLIDFNGRFYGSLSLAIGAGANLPAIWANLAVGATATPARARPRVRYQWSEADVRRALLERRPTLLRDLGQSIFWGIGARHSLWDPRDPAPALARLNDLTRDRARSARADLRPRGSRGVGAATTHHTVPSGTVGGT